MAVTVRDRPLAYVLDMAQAPRTGPPVGSRTLLLRPRLLGALRQRFRRRVLVVVAPAGFGKTTLLAQAVRENSLAPDGMDRWVSCTPDDNLLSVLGAALHDAVGLTTRPADTPDGVAADVADALWAAAPEQVAVFLDDAHLLTPGSPGTQLVTELLARLPRNAHLVLGCRAPVPVPITRLLATGDAVVLDERRLAFTGQELVEFAGLRQVPVETLGRVGSWPALAELRATAGSDAVAAYLWEELLARLDPQRRRGLATLMVAGGADEELMQALTGRGDLAGVLGGLPMVTTTEDGWWSLHPLWGAALQHELPADRVAEIRCLTGRELQRRGRYHEAMVHLRAAAAWEQVRALVMEVCGTFFPLVPFDVLREWWQRLPHDLQQQPEGLLLAGVMTEPVDADAAARLLEASYAAAGGAGDVALACLQSLTMIAFWRSDFRGLGELLERLEALGSRGNPEAAALRAFSQAMLAADAQTVEHELAQAPLVASPRFAPAVDWLRAHLHLLHLGDPETALSLARRAIVEATPTLRAPVRCELVESLRLLGRMDEAAGQVATLVADVDHSVVRTPRHLLEAVVVHAVRGDVEQAERLLPAMRTMVAATPVRWASLAGALAEAAVAVAAGREDDAAVTLRAFSQPTPARCAGWLRINPLALPLLYLLAPGSRVSWDELPLSGCFADIAAAMRALVELRQGSVAAIRLLRLPDWDRLRGQLPLTWAVELATARAAVGGPEGGPLVRGLGQAARPALHALMRSRVPGVAGTARSLLAELPAVPRQRVGLQVLGPLRLHLDGEPVHDPDLRRERVRHLLARLLLQRRVSRGRAAAEMWPDLDESVAARNLRVTLNYVQRLLEPLRDEHDSPYFVRTVDGSLQLVTDMCFEVDAWQFDGLLDEATRAERQATPSVGIAAYRRAVALYEGELLADLPAEEWLEPERDRLRSRFVRAAVRLGQLLLVQEALDEAETLAHRALVADAYHEQAYQLLAEVCLRRGDRTGARRALVRCRERLAELGAEPDAATARLDRRLRSAALT